VVSGDHVTLWELGDGIAMTADHNITDWATSRWQLCLSFFSIDFSNTSAGSSSEGEMLVLMVRFDSADYFSIFNNNSLKSPSL